MFVSVFSKIESPNIYYFFFFQGNKNGKTVCTPSSKQYLISKLPPVLILHLKRFQFQGIGLIKLDERVNFPTLLDLAPVCENPEKLKLYSIYAVVEHTGSLQGGHYVAYVKVSYLKSKLFQIKLEFYLIKYRISKFITF